MTSAKPARVSPKPSGTTAADTIPGYPAFFAKIVEAMKDIPRPPVFAQSKLFQNDSALTFKHEGVDYVLAGPGFWANVPAQKVEHNLGDPFILGGIDIIDIDQPCHAAKREQVMNALCAALTSPASSAPVQQR